MTPKDLLLHHQTVLASNNKPPLVIYHGNCADGFGALWAVWKAFKGDIESHAGFYQTSPPDVRDRDVVIVDFSYKSPVMKAIAEDCRTLIVLDHHESVMLDLANAAEPVPDNVFMHFVMDKSGAMLAWEAFNDGPAPIMLQHIQDRDLWLFKMPGTEAINANLFSYAYDIDQWNALLQLNGEALRHFRREGEAIMRKHHKDIAEMLPQTTRMMMIGGNMVPIANMSYIHASDGGNILCHKLDFVNRFAGTYFDSATHRNFSLRSDKQHGMNVSKIASGYGGGGHRNAAGFKVPLSECFRLESSYPGMEDDIKELFKS